MIKNKNILKKEEEFLKLNAEIELKTKELMNQVDQIKEIQLQNEKFCPDWSISEPLTQVEKTEIESENIQTNYFESHLLNKSPEDNFALAEYLSRRQDQDSDNLAKVENLIDQQTGDDLKRNKIRRNVKPSRSAKLTPSLISAQEEEFTLALGITRHKSDVRPKHEVFENDVIPETLKGVGQDGITRFLSAKVKLLTEQIEIMQKDEKKHLEKIKELQIHKDKSAEEQEKLLRQTNMAKNVLIKFEKHTSNITAHLQTLQTENSNLKKEVEALKKQMRENNKSHNAKEVKLNRALEEIDKLKATLHQVKLEEKEFKEIQRKKTDDLTNTVKTLDKQRMELLNGFKKQLLVIDNLKRQKSLVEAGKLLKSAEEDFINYLDCNPPNTVRRAVDQSHTV